MTPDNVRCPRCGAQPKEMCARGTLGKNYTHMARINEAKRRAPMTPEQAAKIVSDHLIECGHSVDDVVRHQMDGAPMIYTTLEGCEAARAWLRSTTPFGYASMRRRALNFGHIAVAVQLLRGSSGFIIMGVGEKTTK